MDWQPGQSHHGLSWPSQDLTPPAAAFYLTGTRWRATSPAVAFVGVRRPLQVQIFGFPPQVARPRRVRRANVVLGKVPRCCALQSGQPPPPEFPPPSQRGGSASSLRLSSCSSASIRCQCQPCHPSHLSVAAPPRACTLHFAVASNTCASPFCAPWDQNSERVGFCGSADSPSHASEFDARGALGYTVCSRARLQAENVDVTTLIACRVMKKNHSE